ncbi:uncharacterized protein LOC106967375 [Acinonyx jubatus]|uniref:Uncharacterized protein LOC106967375 n=1 Tax=Acinonyx jubatus TaxID=32536 RepID=A0A6J2ACN7_ACIJB|nr:uncharacterized protein LOC106967375 [Acinonyx jubatus]
MKAEDRSSFTRCEWSGGNLELRTGIGQSAGRASQRPGGRRSGETRSPARLVGRRSPGEGRALGAPRGDRATCSRAGAGARTRSRRGGGRPPLPRPASAETVRPKSPSSPHRLGAGPRTPAPAPSTPRGRQDGSGTGKFRGLLWRHRAWDSSLRLARPRKLNAGVLAGPSGNLGLRQPGTLPPLAHHGICRGTNYPGAVYEATAACRPALGQVINIFLFKNAQASLRSEAPVRR